MTFTCADCIAQITWVHNAAKTGGNSAPGAEYTWAGWHTAPRRSTDVYGWKAFFRRNSSHLSGRNLVGETYQRAILEHAKVSIVRVKMAYATLSVYGKAR